MKKGLGFILIVLILGIGVVLTLPKIREVLDGFENKKIEKLAREYLDEVTRVYSIADGTKDISEFSVELDTLPTSGTITLENNVVTFAELVMEGYTIECDKDECKAEKGEFVYFYKEGFGATGISETVEKKPNDKRVYLKYKVVNEKLGSYQTCFYDNSEFCLTKDEYNKSKSKIFKYFGYDKSKWKKDDKSNTWTKPNDPGTGCIIDDNNVSCYNQKVGASVSSNGRVSANDLENLFTCSIQGDGLSKCNPLQSGTN